jgi:serine/threonine protein kinase
VVKFIAPSGGSTVPRIFDEQLKQLLRVTSPNLAALRGGGVCQGWLYVVTEWLEARNLEDWIAGQRATGDPVPAGVALHLFDGVCGALQGAHRQGIAHGALSPATILLRALAPGSYHPWVLDLGVGRWVRDASLTAAVEPPSRVYLAPEQDAGGDGTPRSDVFSLALLLVELLCGTANPGCGPRETLAQAVARNHRGLAAQLAALRSDIHEDFWTTLAAALHPEAAQRPEGAQQLKLRVRAAAQHAGIWRDTPEALPEPPAAPRAEVRAAVAAFTKTRDESVPEGWLHSERMRVDPAAVRGMLRSTQPRYATGSLPASGAMAPPAPAPSAPAPPPAVTSGSPMPSPTLSPLEERTVPALALPDGGWSFADDPDAQEGTERRPSLLPSQPVDPPSGPSQSLRRRARTQGLHENAPSAFQTLPVSRGFGEVEPIAAHPGATMKVLRASVPGVHESPPEDLEATTLADPAAAVLPVEATVALPLPTPVPAAMLPVEATVALPLPTVEATSSPVRPRTMPPSPYVPSTPVSGHVGQVPGGVPVLSGPWHPEATLHALPGPVPFVLRPPDPLPPERPSRWWMLPAVLFMAVLLAAVAWFVALPGGT